MFHVWLIHLSVGGHLGCFRFEAMVNNATIGTWVQVFFSEQMFPMTMRIHLEVELLDPIEILFLTSWETAKPFSTVAPTIYISTAMQKTSHPQRHYGLFEIRNPVLQAGLKLSPQLPEC